MIKSSLLQSVAFHCLKPRIESWAMVGVLAAAHGKGRTMMASHGVAKVCVASYSLSSSDCKGMAKEKHTVRPGM